MSQRAISQPLLREKRASTIRPGPVRAGTPSRDRRRLGAGVAGSIGLDVGRLERAASAQAGSRAACCSSRESPSPARAAAVGVDADHHLRDGLAVRRGGLPPSSPQLASASRARSTPGSAAPSDPHDAAAAAPSQLSRRRRSPRGARRPRRARASARRRRRRARAVPDDGAARPSPDRSRARGRGSPVDELLERGARGGRPPFGTAIENESLPIISGSSSPTIEQARALASSTRPSRSSTTISAPAASR